nr:PREDICTED: putative ATP-dependent RNA helicase DHX57 [Paralichthys olivaceus]
MSTRKSGGKPNRGGGKFNKPRGGRGGGGGGGRGGGGGGGGAGAGAGRKGGAGGWDECYDDFSLDVGPSRSSRPSKERSSDSLALSRDVGRGRGRRDLNGRSDGRSRGSPIGLPDCLLRIRSSPKQAPVYGNLYEGNSKPLQKIFMTNENQDQLKELLPYLQSQDVYDEDGTDSGGEKEEYDELDHREEGQFWATNDEPVERADSPLNDTESDDERPAPEPVISLFAIGKLCRFGFDRERSKLALGRGGGEFGATLEQLLHQVFTERYGQKAVSPDNLQAVPMDECLTLRQEEAQVLAAIFGDRFSERIANTVWTLSLDLSFLPVNNGKKREIADGGKPINNRDVCKFYLKGKGCRFGDKCKFKHQLPDKGRSGSPDMTGPSQPGFSSYSPPEYELEIRFPKGNRYPFQAPIVAFSTNNESVGAPGRLSVTERLFEEALSAAKNNEPAVYNLTTLCEDEATMKELLSVSHHKYSSPPPVVSVPPPSIPIAKGMSVRSSTAEESRSGNISSTDHSHSRTAPPKTKIPLDLNKTLEVEDLDEREENDENKCYISQRKRVVIRHTQNFDNVLQENRKLCREFHMKQVCRRYRSMKEQRMNLPAWQEEENILDILDRCQVLVVSGMTGCGKTTQIPQFILDASLRGSADQVANIICTQPRRISAISVAQRVAEERAEKLGNSVGYQIRLESARTSATRLLYCTTGVLLRRLEGEADLKGVTHVIVDEVHERTEESDFLLLVLKDLIVQRPDLKIILMSATLNANLFSEYFNNCPSIHIPGRTYPVDQFFLEDALAKTGYVMEDGSPYMRSKKHKMSFMGERSNVEPRDMVDDLGDDMWNFADFCNKDFVNDRIPDQQLSLQDLTIRYKDVEKSVLRTISAMDLDKINMDLVESLLEWIVAGKHDYPPGAVLVFLPGLAEIKMLYEQLQANRMFNNRGTSRCVVYPLHSSLSNEEQEAVFSRPPEGTTKIIISTNIAETSVTIDDVVYVIDCGKMKEKRYDASKGMESLEDSWVSQANALQRKGRAGRVASGVCFHLFTSHCFQHQLAEQQLPEIQRVPLEQLSLRIKILDLFAERTLESVFSRLIEPPSMESLDAAKQRLQNLGALTEDQMLTPLGYHLACLPVDVRIGKLMLFGAIFHCLDPALTIAASLASKSPFMSPWNKREEANEKKLAFAKNNSDHLALLQAYKGWCCAAKRSKKAGFAYCKENFLSWRGLQEIASLKRQFAELLSDIGFIKGGLRARVIERMSSYGTDGVLDATGSEANLNSENHHLITAMLCAALYPNVVQVQAPQGNYMKTSTGAMEMQPKASELRLMTKNDGCVHMHPSSINYTVRHYDSPFLVYHEKVKTSRVFIRDCSMVSAYALVLFGGGQVNMEVHKGECIISLDDGWIRFGATSFTVAELVKELRVELDQLLEDKIRKPNMDLFNCPRSSRIIQMIVNLITPQ